MKKKDNQRILARRLAKMLTPEQLKDVAGGTCSCCANEADDLDIINN